MAKNVYTKNVYKKMPDHIITLVEVLTAEGGGIRSEAQLITQWVTAKLGFKAAHSANRVLNAAVTQGVIQVDRKGRVPTVLFLTSQWHPGAIIPKSIDVGVPHKKKPKAVKKVVRKPKATGATPEAIAASLLRQVLRKAKEGATSEGPRVAALETSLKARERTIIGLQERVVNETARRQAAEKNLDVVKVEIERLNKERGNNGVALREILSPEDLAVLQDVATSAQ